MTYRPYLLVLFAVAFVVRILIAVFINVPLKDDDKEYHAIGLALSEGKGFVLENQPTAYRPPGYPFFLSICYRIAGSSPWIVRCVQAWIDTITCLLLYLIAQQMFCARTASIATAILAFFPLHLLYIPRISTEIVFSFFFLLAIWIMIKPWKKHHALVQIVLTGVTWGIATTVRPLAAVFLVIAVWYYFDRRLPFKVNLLSFSVLIIAFTCVLAPWIARNYSVFGRFALTSNTGLNLWIGNHPSANGGYCFPRFDNPLSQEQDRFQQSDHGLRLAFAFAKNHTSEYPLLLSKKLAHFFSSDYHGMSFLQYRPEWSTYENAARVYREFSVPLWLLFHLPYVMIIILGIVGIFCQPTGGNKPLWVLLSTILAYIFIHLVFYGGARYRMPLMPFIILFSANGWHRWRSKTLQLQGWRLKAVLSLVVLLFSILIAEYLTLMKKLP